MLSEIGVPLGVVKPKATASAPASAQMRLSFDAVLLECLVPRNTLPAGAFFAPFGLERRNG